MSLLPGLTLLLGGLFAWLVAAHFKGLRYFDRPTFARNAWFDPTLAVLSWALTAGGLLLLARASRPVFLLVLTALVALWAYRRFVRSVYFQKRLLRQDFARLRRGRPGLSDSEILIELTCRRHPGWGPELIEQMVRDYPDLESFARVLSLMERGFRGFRGRKPRDRSFRPKAE